jgi:peroxiredoxin
MRARAAVLVSAVVAILGSAACAPAGYTSPGEDRPSDRVLEAAPAGSAAPRSTPPRSAPARSTSRAANRSATRKPRSAPSGSAPSGSAPSGSAPSGSAPSGSVQPRPARVRAVVPDALDFTAVTVDGRIFRGSALLGRPAVLWFYSPGCPTCQAQVPEVLDTRRRFGGKVTVVGVAGLDRTATIAAFVAGRGIGGLTNLSDSSGDLWRRFDVTQQGTYVLIDARGQLRFAGAVRSGGLADRVARIGQ